MTINSQNYLIERAYQLWAHADTQEPRKASQLKIVHQLFSEMKTNRPNNLFFHSFLQFFYKAWVNKKVKAALSTYKFDLISSGKEGTRLALFGVKERWFFEQELTKIFKNTLTKNYHLNPDQKAARWSAKIKKFYNKPELLLGSYFLYQLKVIRPKLKNVIHFIEALPLEKICKKTIEELYDDEVVKGVKRYLERPFDPSRKPKSIFLEIVYYTAQENAKSMMRHTYNSLCQRVSNAYHFLRNCQKTA